MIDGLRLFLLTFIPLFVSFLLNVIIVSFIFAQAEKVTKILGIDGSKALAKVMSLLLAAIAVMMVRRGLLEMLGPII